MDGIPLSSNSILTSNSYFIFFPLQICTSNLINPGKKEKKIAKKFIAFIKFSRSESYLFYANLSTNFWLKFISSCALILSQILEKCRIHRQFISEKYIYMVKDTNLQILDAFHWGFWCSMLFNSSYIEQEWQYKSLIAKSRTFEQIVSISQRGLRRYICSFGFK